VADEGGDGFAADAAGGADDEGGLGAQKHTFLPVFGESGPETRYSELCKIV
jgi:hypothetical protein